MAPQEEELPPGSLTHEDPVTGCLSEVKVAIAGLEAATQASIRISDARVLEAQRRATRDVAEACQAAEELRRQHTRRAEEAETRIQRLEEKLQGKRTEITELRELAVRLQAKLTKKSETLATESVKADPVAQREKEDSPSSRDEVAGKDRRKEGQGGKGRRHAKKQRPSDRSSSSDDDGDAASDSEDSSAGASEGRRRREKGKNEKPSRSRRSGRREKSSRSCEEPRRGRERSLGSRSRGKEERSSKAHSRDSRSPRGRQHGRERDTELKEKRREGSSSRSRSRPPWHRSGKGSTKSGKGSGGREKEVALCIPYVVYGKCVWGDKCRERHPDPEDARLAKESLTNKVCRFGTDCKRKDCVFRHPNGRKRDQASS